MELRQKTEFRRLLAPELRQSLKVLTLSLLDLRELVEEELLNNPVLEEQPSEPLPEKKLTTEDIQKILSSLPEDEETDSLRYLDSLRGHNKSDLDFRTGLITKKVTLQDILLRQLGMFANTDQEIKIGHEIIGNIDENGYLTVSTDSLACSLQLPIELVESVLKLIQQFEPAGVAARTIPECLLIQLNLSNETDPLMRQIVENHLEDIAKKNFTHIAKALKEPLEKIEPLIQKILRLDPKPGRNYAPDEALHIVPDIFIEEKGETFSVNINNEYFPTLNISKTYKDLLRNVTTDQATKEFLANKLRNAMELMRAISKRQSTLRKVTETVFEFQQEAIRDGLSHLKPLTFQDISQKLEIHETTVCRVVMNKYVQTPHGVVSLKSFFPSHIHDTSGQSVASNFVLKRIKELIDGEDKLQPLSDQDIVGILAKEDNLKVARRTVTKYREELKILSSTYRRQR